MEIRINNVAETDKSAGVSFPNPNSLKPQPSTGGQNTPTKTPPTLPPQPRPRPIPPPPAAQKPTIINNYYYVSSPPQPGNVAPPQPQQIPHPYLSPRSSLSRASLENRPSSHSSRTQRPPLLAKAPSTSSEESEIYSSPSLARLELHPRLPQIDLDDPVPDPQVPNLLSLLSRMGPDSISVHNQQLYDAFSRFGKDSIDYEDLRQLLINPEGTYFKSDSARRLCNTFVSTTSELEFRDFIRLCKFLKGCYDSFKYHDSDKSCYLEPAEFSKSLRYNQITCPDSLLQQIYRNSPNLNLEAYVLAVILIRKHEREHPYTR
ncbi:hypothetical protein KL918_002046 [Ogataea parapolymorpha]|nr:hypothetical protein KL918_002046 [Ogataea parapolymorpha]KAG7871388.1 hypothetical protein KL916_003968 [Ogataea parapolymorpha]